MVVDFLVKEAQTQHLAEAGGRKLAMVAGFVVKEAQTAEKINLDSLNQCFDITIQNIQIV